ncbi:Protein GVQW3 [Manis javanica]|nr:Protein GVQW3 [Manis javanica]
MTDDAGLRASSTSAQGLEKADVSGQAKTANLPVLRLCALREQAADWTMPTHTAKAFLMLYGVASTGTGT